MNKNFFAGLEELFARLASFLLVVLGFIIFILARNVMFQLDWLGLVQVLGLFWVIYEVLGLIFFQAFHFFAKQQIIPSNIPSQTPIGPVEPKSEIKNSQELLQKDVEIVENDQK